MKVLEKFGLSHIEADGKPFDPSVHHAMSQVVREDVDEEIVVEEFRKGYLLKESSENEIIDCIKSVHAGRPYVNPSLTHLLFRSREQENSPLKKLSEHEINILKLIAMQKTSAEIADMLSQYRAGY